MLALRNQLTVKANEPPVQVNDERLLLVKSWLEDDPGAQDLFAAWEGTNAVRPIVVTVRAWTHYFRHRGKCLSSQ